MVFILALSSCQTNQEQNVAPAEIGISTNKANLKAGVSLTDPISIDTPPKNGDVMTATLVARRGDRNLSEYAQQVFKENEACQAIFRDDISKVQFGYIKELSPKQTTLKAIICERCEDNGVVIEIKQIGGVDNSMLRMVGGPFSEWVRAVFFL